MADDKSAVDMLRAFEDETMGASAPRVDGQVERGHGSLFQRLSPEQRAQHRKLERLVETEDELAQAASKLVEAKAAHEAALAAVAVKKGPDDAATEKSDAQHSDAGSGSGRFAE